MKLRLARPGHADRHRPAVGPERGERREAITSRSGRSPATTTSTTTRSPSSTARSSPTWPAWWATPRCATGAPSAARWPTATRRPTCRRSAWCSTPSIVARGPNGERTIDAADFFRGFFDTALGEDEIITEVRVPEGRQGRLELHQVPPARDRLAHGGRRRPGGRRQRLHRGRARRARQHGPDAAAGLGRRGRPRRRPARRDRGRPPSGPTRAPTRPATPGRAPTSAATWPGC